MNIHEIKRLTEEAMNARKEPYGEGSKDGCKDWKENLHQKESSLKEDKEDSALRDWFAGQIIATAIQRFPLDEATPASYAYRMADAMMRARKKA